MLCNTSCRLTSSESLLLTSVHGYSSVKINSAPSLPPFSLIQGLSHRQQREEYGVTSAPPPSGAPLFQDTSGVPSYPPMSGPQQLLANPVVAATAMHYSQELASRGQAYVDQNVGTQFVSTQYITLWSCRLHSHTHTHTSHTPPSHIPLHHTHHPHTSPYITSHTPPSHIPLPHICPRLNVLSLCRD